ncbi:hypothetical protein F3I27_21865 [Pantoea sp. Bo_2]|uniref:hypothetical protein n=1 Tax=unclassified Pantoea TaxID=2630326 RepID=UPI0012329690|nr:MULTISPECIES: hypothetical protein [unclassified Pantoea]KAA5937585.1 hypothetical protein F3I57_21340 [Pantoea sp. VH_3]KAA5946716.1 hypothetical protein F3I56_22125 [Pantoea sp. VH_25]KAA5949536.1 hypothetical protein F3I55_22480 [Pantoea sp. VH_24]KAA5957717.1 hypothetical protein F3I53_15815 [Pantoea sp. VH_16]KAA5959150.1 hypothetical protein F3I54_22510 [Pantoea sp. VH_18]
MNAEEKQALIQFLKFLVAGSAGQHRQIYEIALAALTAKPIGYIDPATLKEYRGKRAGGSWSAEPKSGEYNQTLPIFTTPPIAAPEQPHHNGMMMLSQKLAAAEAKLAEFEKQEPVGNFYEDGPGNWWQIGPHDKVPHVTPLFDRPAPAVSLAELVPGEVTRGNEDVFDVGFANGFNACRASILRNIAEAQRLNANTRP